MHTEQRQRTHTRLQSAGLSHALFANEQSVRWLTGFAPPVQLGANLFAGGPALVWYEDGHFTLIVLDGLADHAAGFDQQPDCTLVTYPGYTIQQPIASADRLCEALQQVLPNGGVKQIGVEQNAMPMRVMRELHQAMGSVLEIPAIDGWLEPLRMVKTDEEIAKLRANFALTDIGHAAARAATQEGQREIDVWAAIHSAIQQAAGQRIPLGNDCVVGYRQNNIGGWPLDLEIRAGDSLIVDLSTILHGYWSDSCATYYASPPTAAQIKRHQMLEEALDFAIALVKPGAVAREIDQKVRTFISDRGYPVYPHHTGHGVGLTGHEAPRIVPYCADVLEAGMVIMLEPGTYEPGVGGARLEDALLVTADGAEILTKHDKSLP
ncbi:MAG: Xaa-Pro peptidase family protein [Caldilineaceae bacterium]